MKRYHSNDGERLNSNAGTQRVGLKVLGFLLTGVGAIFMIVGLVDFFSLFGRMGMPTKFWCFFVGGPMLAGGISCLKFAYMGAVSRYVAGETAPVVKDTANYIVDGTRESVVGVVREALGSETEQKTERTCPKCSSSNDFDAKFCKSCGTSFPSAKTCNCGEVNDPDAKFCDKCGNRLS